MERTIIIFNNHVKKLYHIIIYNKQRYCRVWGKIIPYYHT